MKFLNANKKINTYKLSSGEKKKMIKKAITEANKEQLEVVTKYYKESARVAN